MNKIYVYVDAENVSFDTFKKLMEEVRKENGEMPVVGKVYGGKEILGCNVQKYLMSGFTYVETSTLSCNKKNLTDMKLIVDCMEDIAKYKEDIECVYVISKDCDFLPLVYKIISQDIKVKTLITVKDDSVEKNMTSLVQDLRLVGYLPVTDKRVLGTLYTDILDLVGEEYESSLVEEYVKARKRKLSRALGYINPSYNKIVNEIPVEEFCFDSVADSLGVVDSEDRMKLFDLYTTKVFGTTIKPKDLSIMLDGKGV